jgi:hypothetical protein
MPQPPKSNVRRPYESAADEGRLASMLLHVLKQLPLGIPQEKDKLDRK